MTNNKSEEPLANTDLSSSPPLAVDTDPDRQVPYTVRTLLPYELSIHFLHLEALPETGSSEE